MSSKRRPVLRTAPRPRTRTGALHYLALHLGYVGSSLLVTNPKLSMIIDNTERSNRGGAGGIIGDFLSTGKE